jgi:diguanylate cyclase (GGDEF)-like protein
MMAQGEALGMLYLKTEPPEGEIPAEVKKLITESRQRLAMTVAEHIALSLANIKLRETLRNQAIRDPLTNLFNRRYMEETLDREMHQAKRENKTIGIIMIDIDFFKRFNDTYGHAAGDTMLRELGAFLKTHIRGGDVACRYGGEEFILILPGANMDETMRRAEYIVQEIRKVTIQLGAGVESNVTLSMGVGAFPDCGESVDDVLRCADTALYRAKESGRNRAILYDSSMKKEE